MSEKHVRCPKCGRLPKRSNKANAMYWALIAQLMQFEYNGQRWGKKAWHEMFKDIFLPSEIVQLPNGKSIVCDPSSADLEPPEFSDYFTQVEAWCAERGVFLADLPT